MSVCENCKRETGSSLCYAGPFRFCSFLCRDTSEKLREYELAVKEFGRKPVVPATCGVPNCSVCSGAMRERAGRGEK